MIIAVDAMGGDHAPRAVVEGVMTAVKAFKDVTFTLVGDEEKIRQYLKSDERINIIHTKEVIENTDAPVTAVRRKKNSSLVVAITEVKEGRADACISAGNTGALMTAGLLVVGRIKGIERPALSPMLPTLDGNGFLLLDVGANMDAKPNHLLQYAIMGSIYMKKVRQVENPRVGLLNVGTESGKGNELTKQSYELLGNSDLNFIGNIESRELLNSVADIIVCDGFSGNLVLKSMEGTSASLMTLLKKELMSTTLTKIAAGILKPSFMKVKKQMNYSEYGGAGLFGLQAPVIKAHGSSDSTAVYNAIRQAREMVKEEVVKTIKAEISDVK